MSSYGDDSYSARLTFALMSYSWVLLLPDLLVKNKNNRRKSEHVIKIRKRQQRRYGNNLSIKTPAQQMEFSKSA